MHPHSAIWSVTILHRSLLAMLPANLLCTSISKYIRNGNKPLFRCKLLSYCNDCYTSLCNLVAYGSRQRVYKSYMMED